MGNCHPKETNVYLSFASVDIGFLGVTISHVTLSCSQYLYNITLVDGKLYIYTINVSHRHTCLKYTQQTRCFYFHDSKVDL